jgi:hypothetical protein
LRNILKGKEAAILGSGPSLDENLPLLKDYKGVVFSGNSTINPCIIRGRVPDWTVVLDADAYVPNQFSELPGLKELNVLLPTYVEPTLPEMFDSNRTWWFNVYHDRHWLMRYGSHYMYPEIDGLLSSGCVPGAMIRLAWHMGIRKIYLLGCDFGYPGGRERCTRYKKIEGEWMDVGHDLFCDDNSPREEVNGILTTVKLRVAHAGVVNIIQHLPDLEAVDCSKGVMSEFQKMEFKEVVNGRRGKG